MDAESSGNARLFDKVRQRAWIWLFAFLPGALFCQELTRPVSLQLKNVPVSVVLDTLTILADLRFSFNPVSVPVHKKVTVDAVDQPVAALLERIFNTAGIDYRVVEGQIVLLRREGKKPSASGRTISQVEQHTISGFVYDQSSRETLIGANIVVVGTNFGVITNGYGYYSLTLPPGNYALLFSYLGYRSERVAVNLTEHRELNVELHETPVNIREVEVLAHDAGEGDTRGKAGELSFPRRALAGMPGFGGDLDIIRALQAVPGIQNFGDGSSLYFVRGGNSDQNLLMIDEVPVFNPSHLFGFFSAFSPDAINHVQVFRGDFPARYGGRLSSVIDIKSREGNSRNFEAGGNIGPYASNLTVQGPVVRDRSSFLVSGRISTLGWLKNLDHFNNRFGFQFFDINAKVNFSPNTRNRFFLTFFYGKDDFSRYNAVEINSYGIGWNNLALAGRWNHLFSRRLFSNTTLSYSHYQYLLNLPVETNGNWGSSVSSLTLKNDISWYLCPGITLRGGLQASLYGSDPGNLSLDEDAASTAVPEVSEYHSAEYVAYLYNDHQIGNKWSLKYGIRLPVWQDYGPAEVPYFDANHQVIDTVRFGNGVAYSTAFSPEPRVMVEFRPGPATTLKANYSRNTQFLQLLSNSTSPFHSLEVWVPCGPNIFPQTADQVSLGAFRELAGREFLLSAEGYAKWFNHRPDYKDHPNLLFNPLIEGELRFGDGFSYGVELMARKKRGKLTGWVGYTWSRALIRTEGIRDGDYYPAPYDRPHNLCIHLAYDDEFRWQCALNWIYLTGGAVSMPAGFFELNGYTVPLYGERNSHRLPDYHRLDLMVNYRFNKPGSRYQHSASITIYNVYGRYNPFSLSFNKTINDKGDFVVPSDLSSPASLVPAWFSVAGIIPSVNYKFSFR